MCILTFLRSISQEGVVEDKDAMRLPTSIKVTEGKLSVIYTGIQCDRIIFFLATEDNDWDMSYQQDRHTEKAIKSIPLWSPPYLLHSDTGLEG